MIELIQALERLLERGIVIEPVGLVGSYRVRLVAEQPKKDPGTIPAESETAGAGGLTW